MQYSENPVRVIDVFVVNFDLAKSGFKIYSEITGRPGYHPSSMLKLFIHGYLNRLQISRWLERESGLNVGLMWLRGPLSADSKTIADLRKDNGKGIKNTCCTFIDICWHGNSERNAGSECRTGFCTGLYRSECVISG